MPGSRKSVLAAVALCAAGAWASRAGERTANWSGRYAPCEQRDEILKRGHMNLGVRFSTSDPALAWAFARAMDFWSTVLDLEWHEDDSADCAVQVVEGHRGLFKRGEAARSQLPDRPAFQGWVAFNREVFLPESEKFLVSVHELGHLLGLRHNPDARSVMFFVRLGGPASLDATDLANLAASHALRVPQIGEPLVVVLPGEHSSGTKIAARSGMARNR